MPQHNRFDCIARFGRDPEKKEVSSTGSVVVASVAVSDGWRDKKEDQWVDDTDWFDIKGWGNFGKKLLDYKKGDAVVIMGAKMKVDKWDKRVPNPEDPEAVIQMQRSVIHIVPGTTIAPLAKKEKPAASVPNDDDGDLPF